MPHPDQARTEEQCIDDDSSSSLTSEECGSVDEEAIQRHMELQQQQHLLQQYAALNQPSSGDLTEAQMLEMTDMMNDP